MHGAQKIATWADIEQFYNLDAADDLRICPKLTDAHVVKDKIKKMKVSCCTQVFSYQVGSLMKRISQWNLLPASAADTAELILFLDQLFDSINSASSIAPASKIMKGGVTRQSGHLDFWNECIENIQKMKFFSGRKNKFVPVPTLKNTIHTLKAFKRLSTRLLRKESFNYVLTRPFNQDALENFFGLIRTQKARNVSPNVTSFQSSFKSLVISNFMAKHSMFSNCEEDISTGALHTFHDSLSVVEPASRPVVLGETVNISVPKLNIGNRTRATKCTVAYISGYFIKKLKKTVKCTKCMNIFCKNNTADTDFIEARQYKHSLLQRGNPCFNFIVYQAMSYLYYWIPRICHLEQISTQLFSLLSKEINFNIFNCSNEHASGEKACRLIIRCTIFFWCKKVNKIAAGKDSKFVKYMHIHKNSTCIDSIKVQAHNSYLNRVKRKK